MDSFRKAYGALKDSTKVGLAKVNSEFKDLDIAIVKATNHAECAPKERHVRKIFAAVSLASPRADVGYCIHALSKRLSKTRSWIVAIKSLIVFHRILRECDNSFREELMHISRRGHIFHISNFKDDSSALAWECSAWVRSYAVFLEERLECFRNLNFEIESSDRVSVSKETESKSRALNVEQLLEQLPALQQLLYRLVCCQPEGAARYNYLVQYALALIVKESFKVYCTINDGIIMLVDTYFDMPMPKAVAALNIYKKAGRQADHLADFYDFCRTLDLARTFQFPILRQPPSSFLETMEDYIKEAPDRMEHQNKKGEARKTEETTGKRVKEAANKAIVAQEKAVSEPKQPPQPIVDLLDLSDPSPKAEQPEETNPLAIAICQPSPESDQPQPQTSHGSGWELALVTAPSTTNSPQTTQLKVGAFDKFMLDSLYEDGVQRQLEIQRAGYITDGPSYGYGYAYGNGNGTALGPLTPCVQEPSLPFGMAMAPTDPRMMMMMMYPQQQMAMQQQQRYEMMMQQQMMMMAPINHNLYASQYQQYQHQKQHEPHHMVSNNLIPYASQYEQHQHQYEQHQHQQQPLPPQQMVSINPFGDPYSYPQSSVPAHGNQTLY